MGRARVDRQVDRRSCGACGEQLERKRFSSGTLESNLAFERRVYCDRSCMAAGMRDDDPSDSALLVRQRSLRKDACEHCGRGGAHLQLHHVDEDRRNDDPTNLLTLCASCHATEHWRMGKNGKAPRSAS